MKYIKILKNIYKNTYSPCFSGNQRKSNTFRNIIFSGLGTTHFASSCAVSYNS